MFDFDKPISDVMEQMNSIGAATLAITGRSEAEDVDDDGEPDPDSGEILSVVIICTDADQAKALHEAYEQITKDSDDSDRDEWAESAERVERAAPVMLDALEAMDEAFRVDRTQFTEAQMRAVLLMDEAIAKATGKAVE